MEIIRIIKSLQTIEFNELKPYIGKEVEIIVLPKVENIQNEKWLKKRSQLHTLLRELMDIHAYVNRKYY